MHYLQPVMILVCAVWGPAASQPCKICGPESPDKSCYPVDAMTPPKGVVIESSICGEIEDKHKVYHNKLCEKYPKPNGYYFECTSPGSGNTFSCRSSCGPPLEDVGKGLNLDLLKGGGLLGVFNNNNQQNPGAGIFGDFNGKSGSKGDLGSFGNFNEFNLFKNQGAKNGQGSSQGGASSQLGGTAANTGSGFTSRDGSQGGNNFGGSSSSSSSSSGFNSGSNTGSSSANFANNKDGNKAFNQLGNVFSGSGSGSKGFDLFGNNKGAGGSSNAFNLAGGTAGASQPSIFKGFSGGGNIAGFAGTKNGVGASNSLDANSQDFNQNFDLIGRSPARSSNSFDDYYNNFNNNFQNSFDRLLGDEKQAVGRSTAPIAPTSSVRSIPKSGSAAASGADQYKQNVAQGAANSAPLSYITPVGFYGADEPKVEYSLQAPDGGQIPLKHSPGIVPLPEVEGVATHAPLEEAQVQDVSNQLVVADVKKIS